MPALPRLLLFVGCLALAGCAAAPSAYSDRLYFGRTIPGGGDVTDAQWSAFVTEVIVPRFPDGFTIWAGTGQWRGDDGASVSEPAMILEVVHPKDATIDAKLAEIAQAYRARFNQEAVMQVRAPAEQTFWRR